MRVLVTGGTGYVGSHVCVELVAAGHDVVVVDNLANSRNDVLDRIASIAGRRPRFLCLDMLHGALLRAAVKPSCFDGVIHLAGLRGIGDSLRSPAHYYRTHVTGTANVIDATDACPFVFASTAAVYGASEPPVAESVPPAAENPYARSKHVAELVVRDLVQARGGSACILRHFNAAGAHDSGRLGDDPRDAPTHLMPLVEQVAVGVRDRLCICGDDYPTRDGTPVRDYVHVMDVARAHRLALEAVVARGGVHTYNLGSGRGHTVLELIDAFERTTGREVPYRVEPRRAGDVGDSIADVGLARDELGWTAERDIDRICTDAMRWRRFWLDCMRPSMDAPGLALLARGRHARGRPRLRTGATGL